MLDNNYMFVTCSVDGSERGQGGSTRARWRAGEFLGGSEFTGPSRGGCAITRNMHSDDNKIFLLFILMLVDNVNVTTRVPPHLVVREGESMESGKRYFCGACG